LFKGSSTEEKLTEKDESQNLHVRTLDGSTAKGSSTEEKLTEKDESQNLHVLTLDGSTAPHCEHVFVTGEFCAADASTPVRREPC